MSREYRPRMGKTTLLPNWCPEWRGAATVEIWVPRAMVSSQIDCTMSREYRPRMGKTTLLPNWCPEWRGAATVEIWVPRAMAGGVIGRGGQNLKNIKSDFNVRMVFVNELVRGEEGPFWITGDSEESVELAKERVIGILDGFDSKPSEVVWLDGKGDEGKKSPDDGTVTITTGKVRFNLAGKGGLLASSRGNPLRRDELILKYPVEIEDRYGSGSKNENIYVLVDYVIDLSDDAFKISVGDRGSTTGSLRAKVFGTGEEMAWSAGKSGDIVVDLPLALDVVDSEGSLVLELSISVPEMEVFSAVQQPLIRKYSAGSAYPGSLAEGMAKIQMDFKTFGLGS